MSAPLTLLHTAQVHQETFDRLRAAIAPQAVLAHHIRADWLEVVQRDGITARLRDDLRTFVEDSEGPVLCTCTSLGPAAEALGALRIDTPMMEIAAQSAAPILVVYVLQSTAIPTLSHLLHACERAGNTPPIIELYLPDTWPLFQANNTSKFTQEIAKAIRGTLANHPEIGTVVLAQASMAGAARMLADMPQTVLTSPETALKSALALA
ncbi:hypothetical protein ACFE33_14045 [Falsihalocynthiibacter sp. SS001]|uniref:hypothetical protein n=1 Tax=Falsihalocynthiibacter sp. SS001 TaxID=3349698 RepID=UPI0036D3682B